MSKEKTLMDYIQSNLSKIRAQQTKNTPNEKKSKSSMPAFVESFWNIINEIFPFNFNDLNELLSKTMLLQTALGHFIPKLRAHLHINETLSIHEQNDIIEQYFEDFFTSE